MDIQNRIMFPPMQKRRRDHYYINPKDCKDFYVNLAKGGTGIIVVEMTFINHTLPLLLGMFDDQHIIEYKNMIDEMHEKSKVKVFIQLEDALPGLCYVDEAPEDMMELFYQNFMSASVRAKKTGADGIELHGACSNLSKRMSLVKRILTGMREICGKNYPIGIRIDASEFIFNETTMNRTIDIIHELSKEKIAYISLSGGKSVKKEERVYFTESIKKITAEYNVQIISTDNASKYQLAESKLQCFDSDIVEICRAILCDPEWPLKTKEGRFDEIKKCAYCNRCMDSPIKRKPTTCRK